MLDGGEDVGHLEREVMNALTALVEETLYEAVRTERRYQFDLPAVRETELCPGETLAFVLPGEQERRAERVDEERLRRCDASNGDRDVIDLCVEHGGAACHTARSSRNQVIARASIATRAPNHRHDDARA